MIDTDGYRLNVGIVLCNQNSQVLWARRIGQNAWQFPQGGMMHEETSEQALYRELWEEIGLQPQHVEILGKTSDWLYYRLPEHLVRTGSKPLCIGQKQIWFLLKLVADENSVNLNRTDAPEFDHWRWVDFWHPLSEVVEFKRDVYRKALEEFASLLQISQKTSASARKYR